MIVEVAAISHPGSVRDANQDRVLLDGWISAADVAPLVVLRMHGTEPLVLAVFDGLGGHVAGEHASFTAASLVAGRRRELSSPDGVSGVLADANQYLYEQMNLFPELRTMGTTVAGVVLQGDDAIGFNVGDSRYFEILNGSLVQLSTEDAYPGSVRPSGRKRSSVVTSTLGGAASFEPVTPHVRELAPAPRSGFLICSDGLTDYCSTDEIEEIAVRPAPLEDRITALRDAALRGGGGDNISIILADIDEAEA